MANKQYSVILSAEDHTRAAFDSARRNIQNLEAPLLSVKNAFGALAGGLVISTLKMLSDEYLVAATSVNKLSAVLHSTGYAAGLTATELENLVQQTSKLALIDDDQVRDGISALLLFRNVQGDVAKEAIRLGAQMTQLGGDMSSAMQQIGSALESPLDASKKLKAMGVFVSAGQEAMMKSMMEVGDIAGAQGMILDLLNQKYGDLSATMNTGAVADAKRLSLAWGELLETLGKAPAQSGLSGWLANSFEEIKNTLEQATALEAGMLLLPGLNRRARASIAARAGITDKASAQEQAMADEGIELKARQDLQQKLDIFLANDEQEGIKRIKRIEKAKLDARTKSDTEFKSSRASLLEATALGEDGKNSEVARLQKKLDLMQGITAEQRAELQLYVTTKGIQLDSAAQKKSEIEGQQVIIGLEKDFQVELGKRKIALNTALLSAGEKELAESLYSVTQRAQQAREDLEKLNVSGSLSAQDYKNRLEQVSEQELKQIDAVRALAAEQEKLNASWEYGAKIALRGYLNEASNIARQTEQLFTHAFHGMEDALISFVQTGKLDFSSLANSIIADLIRIRVQQDITGPLAMLLGGLGGGSRVPAGGGYYSGAGSFDGGGFTGFGSRTGGIDGKGGFPAILHPNETVLDHTRGQGLGGTVLNQTINISIDGATDMAMARNQQLIRSAVQQGNAELVDKLNRQGAF